MLTLEEFTQRAAKHPQYVSGQWRYGQTLFNLALEVAPEVAEQVRATPNDPFYARNVNDPRIQAFLSIYENAWALS